MLNKDVKWDLETFQWKKFAQMSGWVLKVRLVWVEEHNRLLVVLEEDWLLVEEWQPEEEECRCLELEEEEVHLGWWVLEEVEACYQEWLPEEELQDQECQVNHLHQFQLQLNSKLLKHQSQKSPNKLSPNKSLSKLKNKKKRK